MSEEKKNSARNRDTLPVTYESKKKKDTAPAKRSKSTEDSRSSLPASSALIHQFIPFLILFLTLFIVACYIFSGVDGAMGKVGKLLRDLLCGLFGWPAFLIPLILVNLAIYWKKYIDMKLVVWKLILGFVCLLTISSLVHSFFAGAADSAYDLEVWSHAVFGTSGAESNWSNGIALHGGGFFGGLVGGFIRALCGYIGAPIIIILLMLLTAMFYFSVTPGYIWASLKVFFSKCADKRQERKEAALQKEREKQLEAARLREKQRKAEEEAERASKAERKKAPKDLYEDAVVLDPSGAPAEELKDIPGITPAAPEEAPAIILEAARPEGREPAAPAPQKAPEAGMTAAQILDAVFGPQKKDTAEEEIIIPNDLTDPVRKTDSAKKTDHVILVEKKEAALPEEEDEAFVDNTDSADKGSFQPSAYFFPPMDILGLPAPTSREDIQAELQENASKIMRKLTAFKVKISKIEYSRGPAITRYELYPDATTRVNSIASLQNDIALELATTIRMEAPIPNKNAVGIEVPNKLRETVYVREMLDSDKFRSLSSRLSVCLGKDVGGNPVFSDIGKLTHLLIAGTTGSGKSVCVNSIIFSIVYKARPDEVQFIMIDPKKTELGIYNCLPHLKVPVVTDMKRAAGTLNAAVNEMEYRYSLMEELGARSLDGYNQRMLDADPNFVPLPKIVIIIDELADLMMTTPKETETNIVRIAQKARAAGIHLILGTQRPSADIITTKIKSNIPSRIAFAVASGMDSRIIIDSVGADKLLGRGDMLFNPVGSTKPIRLQGPFVSDDEVDALAAFFKSNFPQHNYDKNFLSDIDRETARMEAEENHGRDPNEESGEATFDQKTDPLFNRALHIAVENGTVATSLLQRKLEIGFGRAAKIIDRMEALGFVSGPNGTKPRNVQLSAVRLAELENAGDPSVEGKFV